MLTTFIQVKSTNHLEGKVLINVAQIVSIASIKPDEASGPSYIQTTGNEDFITVQETYAELVRLLRTATGVFLE